MMIHRKVATYTFICFTCSFITSLYKSKESLPACVCVCVCVPQISLNQTDLRVSTWLMCGSRVCEVAFVWTTMIPLLNYFINALQIPLALLTIATIVMCTPETITAEPTSTTHQENKWIYTCSAAGWTGICRGFSPILFCASKLTVVD